MGSGQGGRLLARHADFLDELSFMGPCGYGAPDQWPL